jgi:hypothetical protein
MQAREDVAVYEYVSEYEYGRRRFPLQADPLQTAE